MKSFRFRTFCLPIVVLAGGLQLSCSGDGPVEGEPVGSKEQAAVSCYQTSDCPYPGPCKTVYCRRRSPLSPGTCQVRLVPDGLGCNDGNACTQTDTCQFGTCVGDDPLPPQDACWDNDVDPNIPTTVYESTRFLWDGDGSVQSGVAATTIEEQRAAVIRGKVEDRSGNLLTGVTVTIAEHSEYGSTSTLETTNDGTAEAWFDMVVNGGGELIVRYEKDGYLPVQRKIRVPQQDYVIVDDVKMTALGATAGTVRCGYSSYQVVQTTLPGAGSVRLVFQPNTQFDGCDTTKNYNVRIVEYSTDDNDTAAMPGELPPTSAYTFAAEMRLEDGSTVLSPEFDKAVLVYVDNFLGVDVGQQVPSGSYDETIGAWQQSGNQGTPENGSVLNVNSSGNVETGGVTPPYWSSSEEQLVTGWGNSKDYWRVPLWHFSSFDFNWPFQPPDGAEGPAALNPEPDGRQGKGCPTDGSIIICENQVLGERLPIAGTPIDLVYQSDRVPGYKAASTLKIKLFDGTLPPNLHSVDVDVFVAGGVKRIHFWQLPPDGYFLQLPANGIYEYEWDGKNAYGTTINGAQPVTVRLGYVYEGATYTGGQGFGNVGDGVSVGADPVRQRIVFYRTWKGTIGGWDTTGLKLGGWSIDKLHAYSRATQQLYLGDGTMQTAAAIGETLDRIMGGTDTTNADGLPAKETKLNKPRGITFGPDGSLYIAEWGANRIRKVNPSGIVSTLTSATDPVDVGLLPDQRLVFLEKTTNSLKRRESDGTITTLSMAPYSLSGPMGLAVRPDGTILVADTTNHRVLQLAPDGTTSVFAGDGNDEDSGDEGLAKDARFRKPWGLAVMADGSVLIVDQWADRIRRVDPSGYIYAFAGGGTATGDGHLATEAKLYAPHRVAEGPNGIVYIADYEDNRIRLVDTTGRIRTFAGNGDSPYTCTGDGGQATAAVVKDPEGLAVGPDGAVYYADEDCATGVVRRIGPTELGTKLPTGYFGVPSEDGSQVYVFDEAGRHRFTRDARTGWYLFGFVWDWDSTGTYVPTAILDVRGTDTPRETTIERLSDGNLHRFRSHFGKYTTAGTLGGELPANTHPSCSNRSGHQPIRNGVQPHRLGLAHEVLGPARQGAPVWLRHARQARNRPRPLHPER